MPTAPLSPMMQALLTAGLLYAAYKYGPDWAKGLALGAAGYMAANNLPVVRAGLNQRYDGTLAPAA